MRFGSTKIRQFRSVLRGWHTESHISFDRPKASNGTFAMIERGQKCTFQFLFNGQVHAFNSKVIDWDKGQNIPQVRVSWPSRIDSVNVRKHQRVNVNLMSMVKIGGREAQPAEVLDISRGGCALKLKSPVMKGDTVTIIIDRINIHIQDLRAEVKNIRLKGSDLILGCSFIPNQTKQINEVSFLISSSLEVMRDSSMEKKVLILDKNESSANQLQSLIYEHSLKVVVADSTIDAFHRIMTCSPGVILLRDNQDHVSANLIIKLLRENNALKKTPVILYDSKESPDQAEVHACFSKVNQQTFENILKIVLKIFEDLESQDLAV